MAGRRDVGRRGHSDVRSGRVGLPYHDVGGRPPRTPLLRSKHLLSTSFAGTPLPNSHVQFILPCGWVPSHIGGNLAMKPIWLTLGDKSSSADGLKHLSLFPLRLLPNPSLALQAEHHQHVGQFLYICQMTAYTWLSARFLAPLRFSDTPAIFT